MSAQPAERTSRPAETVASFLAAAAIFVSAVGLAYRPARMVPVAALIALIAAGIGGRATRLAMIAVFVATVCFVVGMAIAVWTSNPIY